MKSSKIVDPPYPCLFLGCPCWCTRASLVGYPIIADCSTSTTSCCRILSFESPPTTEPSSATSSVAAIIEVASSFEVSSSRNLVSLSIAACVVGALLPLLRRPFVLAAWSQASYSSCVMRVPIAALRRRRSAKPACCTCDDIRRPESS